MKQSFHYFLYFNFFVLLLSSCSQFGLTSFRTPTPTFSSTPTPNSTSTSTPPSTPTITNTPKPTLTMTVTVTSTPETVKTGLEPSYETDEIVKPVDGVLIRTKLITDESMGGASISKITIHKGFQYNGLAPEESIAKFVAEGFYKIASRQGFHGSFPEYMQLWRTAQQSGKQEDWAKVQINGFVSDMRGTEYRSTKVILWPMYLDKPEPIPNDVHVVKILNFAFVIINYTLESHMKVLTNALAYEGGGKAFGTGLSTDGVMTIFINTISSGPNVGSATSILWSWSQWWEYLGSRSINASEYYGDAGLISDTVGMLVFNGRYYRSSIQVWGTNNKLFPIESRFNP